MGDIALPGESGVDAVGIWRSWGVSGNDHASGSAARSKLDHDHHQGPRLSANDRSRRICGPTLQDQNHGFSRGLGKVCASRLRSIGVIETLRPITSRS